MSETEYRSTETLRNTLFDVIDGVKSGTVDVAKAKAIAALAEGIVKTAELEINYQLAVMRLKKLDPKMQARPLTLTGESDADPVGSLFDGSSSE